MPRTATTRRPRPDAVAAPMPAETPDPVRIRLSLGTGFLSALTRLAAGGGGASPEPMAEHRAPARRAPNRCEFDYDYYVALQSRRQHQPVRLDRRERPERHG